MVKKPVRAPLPPGARVASESLTVTKDANVRSIAQNLKTEITITDGTQLHKLAWHAALALAGAVQSNPFGPDYEVFKVSGKVFMMTTEVRGTPIVTLKCGPEEGLALREEIATVTAGYHMNKRHWISVGAGPKVTERLLEELVENAYLLVVDKLTRAERSQVMDAIQ